jgi:hypothetical protein
VLICISFIFYDIFSTLVINRCSNFDLIYPVYFERDVIWHIPPDQKVDANTIKNASFGKEAAKSGLANILMYKLQRKKNIESSNQPNIDNTSTVVRSTSIQLLVIWKSYNIHDFCNRTM